MAKIYFLVEISENGEAHRLPYKHQDAEREALMTPDQHDTWTTIRGAAMAASRAVGMVQSVKLAVQREKEAKAAEALLNESQPKIRSISRRLA